MHLLWEGENAWKNPGKNMPNVFNVNILTTKFNNVWWGQESVDQSLRNCLSFPFVRERVENGEVSLHGAYYDFVNGSFERWTLGVTLGFAKVISSEKIEWRTLWLQQSQVRKYNYFVYNIERRIQDMQQLVEYNTFWWYNDIFWWGP